MDRLAMLERMNHRDYQSRSLLVTPDKLNDKMLLYSAVRLTDPMYANLANKRSMNLKFINIVDPTFSKNNLGKSISNLNSSRIKSGIKMQMRKMSKLYHQAKSAELTKKTGRETLLRGLLQMFQVSFECVGAHPIMTLLLPQVNKKWEDYNFELDGAKKQETQSQPSNLVFN
jgi:hypothetical protein